VTGYYLAVVQEFVPEADVLHNLGHQTKSKVGINKHGRVMPLTKEHVPQSLMGWSNGGFFSQFYGMARHKTATQGGNRIAAVVAFTAADPFNNINHYQQQGYLSEDFKLKLADSLGTLSSHVQLWEKIAADPGCGVGLIFEDDAVFKADFKTRFHDLPSNMLPNEWDIFWIGWHKPRPGS